MSTSVSSPIEAIKSLLNSRRYLTDAHVTLEPRFHWQGKEVSAGQALHIINKLVHQDQPTHVYEVKFVRGGSLFTQDVDAPSKKHARAWILTEFRDAEVQQVKRVNA
jgi:hypothetical protein